MSFFPGIFHSADIGDSGRLTLEARRISVTPCLAAVCYLGMAGCVRRFPSV